MASMLEKTAFISASIAPALSLVEIRAAQRTFEGAYMRTALSQFSFALVVLRIFTSEFYPIGALLACYGAAVLLVAVYRRYEGNRQFFDCEEPGSSGSEEDEDREEEREQGAQGWGLGLVEERVCVGVGWGA
ncbi:hypothetical protein N0V88_004692 [Collariella sp. IMI 366227]|nr:hypothetical protein N0V88_004692 [Collariella sp. IMI 366227]